jgi:hypothetical protein
MNNLLLLLFSIPYILQTSFGQRFEGELIYSEKMVTRECEWCEKKINYGKLFYLYKESINDRYIYNIEKIMTSHPDAISLPKKMQIESNKSYREDYNNKWNNPYIKIFCSKICIRNYCSSNDIKLKD